MSETKLGKITTTPKGEWSSTASYERLDIVQLKGTSWIAKRANTGVEPTEGDDWMLSAEGAPQIDDTTVSAETPWSSKNTIDRFCPEITGEGNPVVLENCVEGYPLDVTASWEVQQEGSGTPHLAGYGTNKFQWAEADETSTSDYGLTLEYKAATEEIHIYGTNTATTAVVVFRSTNLSNALKSALTAGKKLTVSWNSKIPGLYFQHVYKNNDGKNVTLGYIDANNSSATFTKPDDFSYLTDCFFGATTTLTTIDTTIKIQIEEGSTATEWTPYAANIRPFVGKESVSVSRYGKNLAPVGNVYTVTGTDIFDQHIPKGTYYISVSKMQRGGSNNPAVLFRTSKNGRDLGLTWAEENTCNKVTLTEDAKTIFVYSNGYNYSGSRDITSTIYDFMITTDPNAEYEPYVAPTAATFSLPETIYAGSVGTDGKVEKTHAVIPISKCNACNVTGANRDWLSIYLDTSLGYTAAAQHLSNTFQFIRWDYIADETSISNPCVWSANTSFGIAVPKSLLGVADNYTGTNDEVVSLIRTWLNTIEPTPVFEAELATPESLTTTPATLPALSGANTITTDADTMTVSAREDPIKIISNLTDRISALEAAATDISEV